MVLQVTVWCVAILLILLGLVGSFVPVLPGTTCILAGVLLQKWLLPATLGWAAVGWIAAAWALSVVADVGCTLLGTKLFGGGKWGMAGASGGALAGAFISLPAVVVGSLLGAAAAEKWLGKRTEQEAWKAGAGAALGFLLSIIPKLVCAFVMVAVYAGAVWQAWPRS